MMSPIKVTLLVLVCSTFGSIAGGAAGYYAALTTPAVSNVAVLDVEDLSRTINVNSPGYTEATERLTLKTKAVVDRLTAAGMVVLDRAHILGSPDQAVIRVDSSN